MPKNDPRTLRAWCAYDWANSAYALVISSTIFPIYFGAVARQPGGSQVVNFLGFAIESSALYSLAVSGSFLLVALINPLLTAIADHSHRKKRFLRLFCYLGAGSCAALFFFTKDTFTISVFLFVLATVGYTGSLVFYNAYLPDIATPDRYDWLSARGYALGYVGSVLLLLFNLSMLLQPDWYGGVSGAMASRIAFLTTGLWWAGFAQYPFRYLPNQEPRRQPGLRWLGQGYRELRRVWGALRHQPTLLQFLAAFFFLSWGVQTIMYVATVFVDQELHLPQGNLIGIILLLQLVAIAGAYGFAWLAGRYGNVPTLRGALVVWVAVGAWAYWVTATDVYALATLIGVVMGGTQALARATYAKLIPAHTPDVTSYFNFYDLVEKLSIVTGTAVYGLVKQLTGDVRSSFLLLDGVFLLAWWLLRRLAAQRPAVNPPRPLPS